MFIYLVQPLRVRAQEVCESRGGRPGLSVLMSLTVSVDVKQHWSQFAPNMSTYIRGHEALHHHHFSRWPRFMLHPSQSQPPFFTAALRPHAETIRTISDGGGGPRTSTSTFTQLLTSVVSTRGESIIIIWSLLCFRRWPGWLHPSQSQAPFFSVSLRPQRPYGLLGTATKM